MLTSVALVVVLLAAATSAAQEQPTIAKDSVQVTAFTLSSYKGDFKTFSWLPRTQFRVNGPIASGSQLYVEFTVPGTGARIVLMQTTILASVSRALANLGFDLRSNHLGLRVGEVLRLSFENADKLVRSHVSRVLTTLVFSEFTFS